MDDSSQFKLLRTLSESGDVADNVHVDLLASLVDEEEEGREREAEGESQLAGVDAQETCRVSSPDSDSSKDGKRVGRTEGERGREEELCARKCVMTGACFSPCLDADSEAMGDEDEGFDEEFCDGEELPPRSAPEPLSSPINLQELNQPDIQSLLVETSSPLHSLPVSFPTPSLLDDVDPGVYMLEAESSTQSLLDNTEAMKSPLPSPYAIATPSPVCANLQSMTLSDTADVPLAPEWDYSHQTMFDSVAGFGESGLQLLDVSPSSSSHTPTFPDSFDPLQDSRPSHFNFSFSDCPVPHCFPPSTTPTPPPTTLDPSYGLDMLVSSICGPGPSSVTPSSSYSALPLSLCSTPHLTVPGPPPQRIPDSESVARFSNAHTEFSSSLLDIADLSSVMDQGGVDNPHLHRHIPSPSPSPSPAPSASAFVPSPPTVATPVTNYGSNPALNGLMSPNTVYVGHSNGSYHGSSPISNGTEKDVSDGSLSCATQTPLSPAPSIASSHTPSPMYSPTSQQLSPSTDPDEPRSKHQVDSKEDIVHMPFYQFKRILDSPVVPEHNKSDIKNVRRRGKNKIAAKNCRQRKLDLLLGLQQEIEQLKRLKAQFSVKNQVLQREISHLKTRCSSLSSHKATPPTHSHS